MFPVKGGRDQTRFAPYPIGGQNFDVADAPMYPVL